MITKNSEAACMDGEIWQELYRNVMPPKLNNAVVGFNANLDRVITVTSEVIQSPTFRHAELSELKTRLIYSMQHCTAEEWYVIDGLQYNVFKNFFSDTGDLAIGGQAGIAAVHLASIGVPKVVCVAPAIGKDTVKILKNAGVFVVNDNSGSMNRADTTHLVFEYSPGLVPLAEGAVARNNRFIVSPVHGPESVLIPENLIDEVLSAISSCNRAFLSGYQYLQVDEEFALAADQILVMKKNNNQMRIHVECVSVTDDAVIGGFLRYILPVADSIGLNEHELLLLLHYLDPRSTEYGILGILSPVQLVKGAIEVCRKSGLKRLHLHAFGYYVLVLRTDRAHPPVSLNALLFASLAAAHAAQGNCTDISPVGIDALEQVDDTFGPQISPGIFLVDAYTIIIIPTIIAQNIMKSSGLGDILSSTAFVADKF
jgi:ADP-dependent phosphofructokinase/glucokinase